MEHSLFWDNGLTATGGISDSFSIFVNSGAKVVARNSTFGPAGTWGLKNSSTLSCGVESNYWDAADGPNAASWIRVGGNGSGSHLESDYIIGGPVTVTYTPFLTQTPVVSSVKRDAALPLGGSLAWDSQLGVTLELNANPVSQNLTDEIVGVLKVNDTASLKSVVPPPGLVPGEIYAVWVSTPLRLNSSGSLTFSLPSENGNILLKRREFDGTWTSVPSTWDAASHLLTYSPADLQLLNGTFALTREVCRQCMRDLITYFYNTVLGRPPEAGAVDNWETGYFNYALNLNIDVKFIPVEMGRGFFLSTEYQNRNRSNGEFITDCYRAFLHRDPSPGELDNWLSGVWNRPEVMAGFANSAEFAAYVANLFPGYAGLPTRNFVTTLYIGLLDRLVDAGGLLYCSGLIDSAADKRAGAIALGLAIIDSPEFQAGVKNNEDRVIRIYRAFLGRFPSDAEVGYWAGELTAGRQTVSLLVDLFAHSNEFTQILTKYSLL